MFGRQMGEYWLTFKNIFFQCTLLYVTACVNDLGKWGKTCGLGNNLIRGGAAYSYIPVIDRERNSKWILLSDCKKR